VHSMAHKTGAVFSTGHITHGCANAMYLPYVIKYNAKDARALQRYAEIADYAGIPGKTPEEKVQALREKIWAYNQKFEIPHDMKAFGVDEAEFKSKVAEFSKNAVADACTGSNPRAITPEQMEKLFGCCYYGTEVDF
ncbi:MAG: iron-containing alcohol dehydrogenase, partial [Clostridiales bacterium]|nr:iron-containing alcohol dehydrogenase [Clostridiales bacterium]